MFFELKKSKWETTKGRTEHKLSLRYGMKNKGYEWMMEFFKRMASLLPFFSPKKHSQVSKMKQKGA